MLATAALTERGAAACSPPHSARQSDSASNPAPAAPLALPWAGCRNGIASLDSGCWPSSIAGGMPPPPLGGYGPRPQPYGCASPTT